MTALLNTNLEQFTNDLGEVIRAFTGLCEVRLAGEGHGDCELALNVNLSEQESEWIVRARLDYGGKTFEYTHSRPARNESALIKKRHLKRAAKIAAYRALVQAFAPLPWGSLTGIRPTRLARELFSEADEAGVRQLLLSEFDLFPKKTELIMELLRVQEPIVSGFSERDICVYVGIPFCRTRCLYCSFASLAKGELIDEYLIALESELLKSAQIVKKGGYRVRSVYFGGGTPTVLSLPQLERLLRLINDNFAGYDELTVEAGRPDTIDAQKLKLLRRMGVSRLCINPQSMNDVTLARIGRGHTAADVAAAFEMARAEGFELINADVIAGLPGEGLDDMRRTLDGVAALLPQNLTVHTLAIKRASRLMDRLDEHAMTDGETVAQMTELGESAARAMGMRAYYMYRQKYMRGNLENVGYSAAGTECIYNVAMMEELTSILALGAGSISKRVIAGEGRVERQPNPKDIATYIALVPELVQRKEQLLLS